LLPTPLADLADQVCSHEWQLSHHSASGMLIYAMVQELATWVHYRNLRRKVSGHCDPALSRLLRLISIDERAHHSFYARVVRLFLELDRKKTLDQLRRVLQTFSVPATYLLADSHRRMERIKQMQIFDEEIFLHEVYQPVLATLSVTHRELRAARSTRKSDPAPA
jgi:acyl-[acyl-carrier-protein] desaturase